MSSSQRSVFEKISAAAGSNSLRALDSYVLPAQVIAEFEQNGIEPGEIDRIIGRRDQLLRLVKMDEKLSPDQTDRAARLARIVDMAEKVFGKREKAFLWLRFPNPELDGRQPLECLVREEAARAVEEALIRIDHGIVS